MRWAFAFGATIASLGLTAAANASVTEIFALNQDGCTGSCNPNANDNVTVVDDGSGTLQVTVSLFGLDSLHNNPDSQHHALAFDLLGSPTITISNVTAPFVATGPTEAAGSVSASPFGTFEYVINWPKVTGPKPTYTTFSFDMTDAAGLTYNDIVANSDLIYFASDIIGANGKTGNIGANSFTIPTVTGSGSSAPEPSTWAMMLAGFASLGYAGYRGRRSTVAAAF
jgi:hypothetical protein